MGACKEFSYAQQVFIIEAWSNYYGFPVESMSFNPILKSPVQDAGGSSNLGLSAEYIIL